MKREMKRILNETDENRFHILYNDANEMDFLNYLKKYNKKKHFLFMNNSYLLPTSFYND
jgi:hypothetical protein